MPKQKSHKTDAQSKRRRWLVFGIFLFVACDNFGVVGRVCPARVCSEAAAGTEAARDASVMEQADGDCAPMPVLLQRKRLDINLVLDDSASMGPYWEDVLAALDTFMTEQASADIGVGLTLFGNTCDDESYAQPLVPIAPLPANRAALQAALPLLPVEGAATLPTLQGSIRFAQSWSEEHPDSDVIVLMMTAAVPLECNTSLDEVSQLARMASELDHPVTTEIVVLDVSATLNMFWQLSVGQVKTVTQATALDILGALRDVRSEARACQFSVPDTLRGRMGGSSVVREHADGGFGTVPEVADVAACSQADGGWYYADPEGSAVVLCPHSCESVGSDPVRLLTGCSR